MKDQLNKKHFIIIVISLILIICLGHYVMFIVKNNPSEYKYGEMAKKQLDYMKSNKMNSDTDEIVAYVGELPVYKQDILDKAYEIELLIQLNPEIKGKSIWEAVLFSKNIIEYANQNNLVLSDKEFDEMFEKNKESTSDDFFKEYLKGAGLTSEQFWIDSRELYRYAFLESKVRCVLWDKLNICDESYPIQKAAIEDYFENNITLKIENQNFIDQYR